MGAVARQVFPLPHQAVLLARRRAVAPQVRSPEQHRRLHRAARGVVVEVGVALDLVADQPADRERTFVGIRLRVQRRRHIARVDTAGEERDPAVREALLRVLNDGKRVRLQLLAVVAEFAGRPHVGELDPDDLDLPGADLRHFQPAVRLGPGPRPGIDPLRHRLAALGTVHDPNQRRLVRVLVRDLLEERELLRGVRHADGNQADRAVLVRLAVGVERLDHRGRLLGRGLVRFRRLVLARAVQAAVLALVLVGRGHLRERLEADRHLAGHHRLGRLAQADRLDDRSAVLALDGDRHLGAFLQFLGLQAVRQRFAVGAEDLDVLVDLHRAILPAGVDVEETLLGIDLRDGAGRVEGRQAADADDKGEKRGQEETSHDGCPFSGWRRARNGAG